MIKRADEKFDEIVLKQILPLIAEAFCDLDAEMKLKRLSMKETEEQVFNNAYTHKADQMKNVITDFINGQLRYFTSRWQRFYKDEKTPDHSGQA